MSVRLAYLFFDRDKNVWKLRLDPDDSAHGAEINELPDFGGDIRNPQDIEKMSLILGSWGVRAVEGGWQDAEGGWVVPVLRHR